MPSASTGPVSSQLQLTLSRLRNGLKNLRAEDVRQFLLSGSFEFPLASDPRQNPASRWTTWGKSSISRFGSGDGDFSMDGDVITMTFGIDREWNRWIAGVALSQSAGDGSLGMDKVHWGNLESSTVSVHPYLRFSPSEGMDVWTVLGYGRGEVIYFHDKQDGRAAIEMKMGALG